MSIKCCLYDLLEVSQGDAETLFQVFLNVLERDEIPSNNIIGFAADTTNVMFGEHNSVVSRLKRKKFRISLPCAVFVTLLIYVHHMPVKSFPVQLRNYCVMCTTIFAIVPNVKKSLEQFNPLLV